MGLDTLKAHGVCCVVAKALGGIVFPPHHYAGIHGMSEKEILHYTGNWGNIYTDASAESHLADIIRQLEMAGIKVLVLYSGHYPTCQVDMIKRIADEFNSKNGLQIIPFSENMIMKGDHAGMSETSFMLYLDKNLVNMSDIKEKNYEEHGWNGEHIPENASASIGEKHIEMIIDYIEKETGVIERKA